VGFRVEKFSLVGNSPNSHKYGELIPGIYVNSVNCGLGSVFGVSGVFFKKFLQPCDTNF